MDKIVLSLIRYMSIVSFTLVTLKINDDLQWSWKEVLFPFVLGWGVALIYFIGAGIKEVYTINKENKLWKK